MEWESNLLYLEVPEGKDEAWCREQEFELLGNVFNIGKLAADSAKSAVNTRDLIDKTLVEIEYGSQKVVVR